MSLVHAADELLDLHGDGPVLDVEDGIGAEILPAVAQAGTGGVTAAAVLDLHMPGRSQNGPGLARGRSWFRWLKRVILRQRAREQSP